VDAVAWCMWQRFSWSLGGPAQTHTQRDRQAAARDPLYQLIHTAVGTYAQLQRRVLVALADVAAHVRRAAAAAPAGAGAAAAVAGACRALLPDGVAAVETALAALYTGQAAAPRPRPRPRRESAMVGSTWDTSGSAVRVDTSDAGVGSAGVGSSGGADDDDDGAWVTPRFNPLHAPPARPALSEPSSSQVHSPSITAQSIVERAGISRALTFTHTNPPRTSPYTYTRAPQEPLSYLQAYLSAPPGGAAGPGTDDLPSPRLVQTGETPWWERRRAVLLRELVTTTDIDVQVSVCTSTPTAMLPIRPLSRPPSRPLSL
jgi:hypothetical protein